MKCLAKNVILVRHGIAVDLGEKGAACDRDRRLSGVGRDRTRQAASGLKAIGCRPEVLISSPLRRAVETAEIVRAELGNKGNVIWSDALLPDAEPDDAVQVLNETEVSTVMMVGHMPHLSRLVSFLLRGDETLYIPFKKAAACLLALEEEAAPGKAVLQWLLPPAVLRALGDPVVRPTGLNNN